MNSSKTKGFTLIELMIVVAIIGILAAIAAPAYRTYTDRSAFSEVILATSEYKSAIYTAILTKSPSSLGDLDAGQLGIPANSGGYNRVGSITVSNGVITAEGAGGSLAGVTFILTPSGLTPPITWTKSGSCITLGIC